MQRSRTAHLETLGLFRFLLSVAVVLAHLCNSVFLDAGRNAVVGFFFCSGFLITKICNETYRNRPLAFFANRALRIFPAYWMTVVLIVLTRALYPELSVNRFSAPWPSDGALWINQLTILKLASADSAMIIPQAWSLNVELILYIVIGIGTYRSFGVTVFALAVSVATAVLGLLHWIPVEFYRSAFGAGFMFFGGSLTYFLSSRITVSRFLLMLACVVYAASAFVLPLMLAQPANIDRLNLILLLSAAVMPLIIIGMQGIEIKSVRRKKLFSYLGRLSYPVFLLHVAVSIPVSRLVAEEQGFTLFTVCFMITVLMSCLILHGIEAPLEALRADIRGKRTARDARI